jgi:hypothetical protein
MRTEQQQYPENSRNLWELSLQGPSHYSCHVLLFVFLHPLTWHPHVPAHLPNYFERLLGTLGPNSHSLPPLRGHFPKWGNFISNLYMWLLFWSSVEHQCLAL